jgi:alpha-L-fucosidase
MIRDQGPRLLAIALGLVLATDRAPALSATPRPAPCAPARYLVRGAPVGVGAVTSQSIEVGGEVGLGAACGGIVPKQLRTDRKGATRVRAKWESCDGFAGPVTLKASIVDGCATLAGTVRARGVRQDVEADRSECSDGVVGAVPLPVPYAATAESLATHAVPSWFADAKFGIMIHWGIFTIPAWAETVIDPAEWLSDLDRLLAPPDYGRDWFTHIPYTEWYSNTILIDGSPAQAHHWATYGADFAYEQFRPQFEAAASAWSAATWADLFRAAGARYAVLVTKHHDGFALWPTGVAHPTRPGWHAARNFVGELTGAVRERCLRMGLYYSGGADWSVQPGPFANTLEFVAGLPQSPEYIAYADGQWRELIARYRPAVLWNDISYPNDADELALFADYYNTIPEGVINDRFSILPGLTHHDYLTPEFYVLPDVSAKKFETVRGMGRGFGYNRNESEADYDSADSLIHLLVDVVSKNGNLLLNVGPQADGTIPPPQVERLQAIGAWLGVNGEAIYGTRPWVRAVGVTGDGLPVRFTTSAGGSTVYAIVLGSLAGAEVRLVGVAGTPSSVRLLGAAAPLTSLSEGGDLRITLPAVVAPQAAHAFALSF